MKPVPRIRLPINLPGLCRLDHTPERQGPFYLMMKTKKKKQLDLFEEEDKNIKQKNRDTWLDLQEETRALVKHIYELSKTLKNANDSTDQS